MKQLKEIQDNETKMIRSDSEILKYCKIFFSNLHTKTQTNTKIQAELLKPIQPKINAEENEKLT